MILIILQCHSSINKELNKATINITNQADQYSLIFQIKEMNSLVNSHSITDVKIVLRDIS